MSLYKVTYIFISIAGEVDGGSFILHVDRDPADLRQHVLEIPEVRQEIHYGVSNLKEHWFTIPNADQWTRVVYKDQKLKYKCLLFLTIILSFHLLYLISI